jgi:hypothetical protein
MIEYNFVCVLRSSGTYTPEYVHRLAASLHANFDHPHRLIVLTDLPKASLTLVTTNHQECRWMPLVSNWKGWWSKIELFRGITGIPVPVVYFDLDTIIKKNITGIVETIYRVLHADIDSFISLDDWLSPPNMNSSVMAFWSDRFREIHDTFFIHPDFHMGQFKKWPAMWGDQGFIQWVLKERYHLGHNSLQLMFPNHFVSYKVADIPEREAASVICFHGSPKPHERNWSWK